MISQFEVKINYQKRDKYFCVTGVSAGKSMTEAIERVEEVFAQDPEATILSVEIMDTLEGFSQISDEEVII